MRSIGLIGGMSFESTIVYYKVINEMVRERLGAGHSARIVLESLDFADIIACQKAGDWDGAADILSASAGRLEQAGADCVLICTNTMHLVADQVAGRIKAPLINIIDETAAKLSAAGRTRPLLLATRYTMEHGFYADRMKAAGIDIMVPDQAGRDLVHSVIFDELCCGITRPESRAALMAIIETARAEGADSVILGCTEICLLLNPDALPLPGFDSTAIHACAAVRLALG